VSAAASCPHHHPLLVCTAPAFPASSIASLTLSRRLAVWLLSTCPAPSSLLFFRGRCGCINCVARPRFLFFAASHPPCSSLCAVACSLICRSSLTRGHDGKQSHFPIVYRLPSLSFARRGVASSAAIFLPSYADGRAISRPPTLVNSTPGIASASLRRQ